MPPMIERFQANMNTAMLRRLLAENLRSQSLNYGTAILAMIVIAIMTALTAWIMRDIIDSMVEVGNRGAVFSVAAAVAAIFTVKGIASYIQVISLSRAGNRIVADQQRKLYDQLLRHGVAFFNTLESSNILMRVTTSAQAARVVIDTLIMGFVRDLLTLIGLIIVMVYQQPTLSFFSLVFGPLAVLGVRQILKRVQSIVEANMASTAEIIKVVQETSTGIRVVKAFALEKLMAARMNAAVSTVENRSNAMARLQGATSPLMETLSGFAIASVVALSTISIFGDDATSPGELMSFVTALLMAYDPAKRLARMRVVIEEGLVGVGLMYQILDTPIAVSEEPDAKPLPDGPGAVRFADVTFGYEDKTPLLRGLDVTFEAGKTTALVGPSGGGKSTIINLILRLYDPGEGRVEIDGFDVRQATFASLRDKIAFVGQETFLFDGSLKENIAMGRENASDAEIIAAAKAANAHDFISAMPQGYDTDVGENGANLSGGQRQRIAIARAILRDSPILIMDEATSALDAEAEHLVNAALQELSKGRTAIVIAHRLSTILSADKIVVLQDGQVVEEGTHSALLSQAGLFKRLYDRQFSGS
ncbi:ABC transporter permease [Roseobacter cerasinus]|uniref:ABC transporter permease n=1 Tax=Roseobacter cerasinus TaxID=2602289 RepID=A0A640W1W2_9RHOB|nr:ABC transporter ATP-binding protein [Roseobacter cerasinus]GFE52476.1 ABC transporter permease [Roseobacter cerasinus]